MKGKCMECKAILEAENVDQLADGFSSHNEMLHGDKIYRGITLRFLKEENGQNS